MKTKLPVVSSLYLRAYQIYSPIFIDNEISFLTECFKRLGYPSWFIQKWHFKAWKAFYCSSSNDCVPIKPYLINLYVKENKFTLDELKHLRVEVVCSYPSTVGEVLVKNSPKVECTSEVYCIPLLF